MTVPKMHHSAIVMVPPDALQMGDSIELGIILTRMVQRAKPRA
jgi:hypothetical protein